MAPFTRIVDKRVVTLETEEHSPDFPTESLVEFAAWVSAQLAKIPPLYWTSARIEFGADERYGAAYPTIEISYVRPENDEEYAARLAAHEAQQAAEREHRRVQFEKLKSEFEA